jgi:hypothetical protein
MKPSEISAIFAGGGVGAIAMVLPVVYALHYFGPRLVFGSLLMYVLIVLVLYWLEIIAF